MTKFAFKIGYDTYLLSAKDAVAVMDVLANAPRIDSEWTLGNTTYHLKTEAPGFSLEVFDRPVLSTAEYAAYRAKRDAERAAADKEDADD